VHVREALPLAGVHESMARATDPLRFLKLYRKVRAKDEAYRAVPAVGSQPRINKSVCILTDLCLQDVRSGLRDCKVYQEVVHELTVQIQKQPPADDTIAARLLSVIVRPAALVQL
jgi:hypothetical protein